MNVNFSLIMSNRITIFGLEKKKSLVVIFLKTKWIVMTVNDITIHQKPKQFIREKKKHQRPESCNIQKSKKNKFAIQQHTTTQFDNTVSQHF